MTVNAINAVKNYYESLDNKAKAEFQKETGFNSLYSINLMDPKAAEKFCKSHNIDLGTTSAWNLYNKGKADYAAALGEYNQANQIFKDLKNQKETAQKKYNTLVNNFKSSNGDDAQINTSQDKKFRSESKYTTDLIKSTTNAEFDVNMALSARQLAVNEQRHGLMYGASITLKG